MTFCMIKMFNILFIDCYCYAYVKLPIVIGRVRVQIKQSVCLSVCLSVCKKFSRVSETKNDIDKLFDFNVQIQVH